MNKQERIEWVCKQIDDATARLIDIDHNLSPRAFGYWDGMIDAYRAMLKNLGEDK